MHGPWQTLMRLMSWGRDAQASGSAPRSEGSSQKETSPSPAPTASTFPSGWNAKDSTPPLGRPVGDIEEPDITPGRSQRQALSIRAEAQRFHPPVAAGTKGGGQVSGGGIEDRRGGAVAGGRQP